MNLKLWTKIMAIASLLVLGVVALITIISILFTDREFVWDGWGVESPEIFQTEVCKQSESTGEIDYDMGLITSDDFRELGVCFTSEDENYRPLIVYWYFSDQTSALLQSEDFYFSPGELIFISMYESSQIPENVYDMQNELNSGNLIPGNYTALVRHGRNDLARLEFEVGE